MEFKANEGAQGQTNVVALATGTAKLTAFDTGELLERTMVDLDAPGALGVNGASVFGQCQQTGCPMFHVAVCGNQPEQAYLTVTR